MHYRMHYGTCIRGKNPDGLWRGFSKGTVATILLIDDDLFVRTATRRVLTGVGHAVWEAADGESGIELYRNSPSHPDLVITDTRMPRMNGFEVIRRIRALRQEQPILRITSWAEPDRTGVNTVPVLEKPFEADALLSMVSTLVSATV